MQEKNPMVNRNLIRRVRGERGGDKIEAQLE